MGEVVQFPERKPEPYVYESEGDRVFMQPASRAERQRAIDAANNEFVARHLAFKRSVRILRWSLFFVGAACFALEFYFASGIVWCSIFFAKSLLRWSQNERKPQWQNDA